MPVTQALQAFAQRIRDVRRANAEVPETGLAPAFQALIETLLPLLPAAPALTVVPEFRNPGVGRPDIALVRPGAPARAFIELKAPDQPGDPTRWRGHNKAQFQRFGELPSWGISNFSEFRLFERDAEVGFAIVVPARALRPDTADAEANRLIANENPDAFLNLLTRVCAADAPAARDAEHLAQLLAHSARLVRGIVQDRLAELHAEQNDRAALMQVRKEFRDVLYAHPEAGGYSANDFDTLFSAAFAQTLAFGLLLVREGTDGPVDHRAWERMPEEHPLMRTALRVLSMEEVVQDVGIGFDVMLDTVNSFAAEILAIRPDGRDPILYFYEDFLETFDPAARERYGVYYTPIEVVRYMAGALDRALRENLNTQGLQDPNVTILDPATGTGTFLLGIAERVRNQVEAANGPVEARMALRDLARRMFGFELLVGPYAVAHYRLHHALRARREGDEGEPLELPRLGVYLTDTLAQPGAAAPAGPLGFVSDGIADERHAADEVKAREPILAIIGNPPYKRLEEGENETLVGRWMDDLWDDLKRPVRDAGQGNQLNTFPEFSVAFWRWAIWKLFEAENAPQRGVIAFITNRKFLTGWPYAGLRKMMREKFDRIEVIDLRGDVRAGPRGDVASDQGVFNIMVGTAITLAIADGSKAEGELAEVRYFDSWSDDLFSRRAKLVRLAVHSEAGTFEAAEGVENDLLESFRPLPFTDFNGVHLKQVFAYTRGGIQTKRDSFIYATSAHALTAQIRRFLAAPHGEARAMFHDSRDKKSAQARLIPFNETNIRSVSYRPLDHRVLYNHSAYGDFLRPELQQVWGHNNVCLYSLKSNTGAGPAVWCHGLLPDYHSIKGSNGGYAFPLYDRRSGPDATNLNPALIEGLSLAYGRPVTAPDVFDAILCLLSATSYTHRFAEDLEDTFPHVAFPADHEVFTRAVAIGCDIREIETFARLPEIPQGLCAIASEPTGAVASGVAAGYADGAITLCENGSGRITGIPEPVWRFAVSGYRVLPRWIEGREGVAADLAFVRELRDVAARIAALLHSFDAADLVLADTLADSLTREELGLDDAAPDQDEDA
ncbi:N-6 DNA methylase [Sphingomonas suaedae]|uniref:site-specific DNA-methyltransferase (adenine-specific) n=1 Tax=Sphingomonas suaedae TaxID=2599297 RepID=A0A518RE42_9SPHN|nr:type ISP restriction/modification enzyme [Sphingomonas suaedae]QDX25703.1 N-6 DNA methylase [Sphingomonas suaedae]